MKLKNLRKVISKDQFISLVNHDGHFYCCHKNSEMDNENDELEVTNIECGNASFGVLCMFITVVPN
ncbi:MAG: hypothetical protein IJ341_02520 [Bacteroidales bacterium]|nr:hypothetical protein [Bacteroidales bacterium]